MIIIIAILIFSLIIIFHELGHFLLAKANHITVTEFAVGMGPILLKTTRGETTYALKLLPFGGSCAMLGEDEEESGEGSFNSKSVWARMAVIAAGPVFNLILAFFLSIIVISYSGSGSARVVEVAEGSPEAEAGLEAGDVITSYNGRHISLGKELSTTVSMHGIPTDEIRLTVERDGEDREIVYVPSVTTQYRLGFSYDEDSDGALIVSVEKGLPMEQAGIQAGDVVTGINGADIDSREALMEYLEQNPLSGDSVTLTYLHNGKEHQAVLIPEMSTYASLNFSYSLREDQSSLGILKYSALEVKYWIEMVIDSLGMLFTGQYGLGDLSGPVGVVDAIGKSIDSAKPYGIIMEIMTALNMAILLSANLGVMNLIPFPALDGGRLVFLIVEAIRRKPVKRDVEGMIHFGGLILLMVLMVYVLINDVGRIL